MMLQAPKGQIDDGLMDIVKTWQDDPTAVDLLKAIDFAIYFAATSGFVLSLWQSLYENKPVEEKDNAVKVAEETWRTER